MDAGGRRFRASKGREGSTVGEAVADREPVDADAAGGGIGRSDTLGPLAKRRPRTACG